VKIITIEFNKFTTPTAIEDLKVGDIFESKVKLLQVITEWSIKRGVLFTPVKTNKSCYTTVCDSIKEQDNVDRKVCPWRLHAFVPNNPCGYFKIKSYIEDHTCSQPSLQSNNCKATTSFVCNVVIARFLKYITAET